MLGKHGGWGVRDISLLFPLPLLFFPLPPLRSPRSFPSPRLSLFHHLPSRSFPSLSSPSSLFFLFLSLPSLSLPSLRSISSYSQPPSLLSSSHPVSNHLSPLHSLQCYCPSFRLPPSPFRPTLLRFTPLPLPLPLPTPLYLHREELRIWTRNFPAVTHARTVVYTDAHVRAHEQMHTLVHLQSTLQSSQLQLGYCGLIALFSSY